MLGRKPANKKVSKADVEKVASLSSNKEGFMNSVVSKRHQPIIERLASAVDPTKTIEFQAWRDWLQNGDVTLAEFQSILENSAE